MLCAIFARWFINELVPVIKLKEFFDMKRHERRGTIVLLALITALLAVTVLVRDCSPSSATVSEADIRQFEAEADTTTTIMVKPSRDTKAPKHHHRRHSAPKKNKPSQEPRRLDPVPQF